MLHISKGSFSRALSVAFFAATAKARLNPRRVVARLEHLHFFKGKMLQTVSPRDEFPVISSHIRGNEPFMQGVFSDGV
ncbi:hypothetical protein KL86DES1_20731 [uncultured Desulfovibrio sp.]|uniref:Uncharacterized protein n=1 Tax=uncultured Desulfovibrio sp. TaxID=167968 RepID=A0A212L4W3_9BACT|nr:hypothetical protein KL86DES1_20731 [uncultured Desulfovibrio sp.]VZH33632.1 conserved protein of unknown function [Desulfovibrio sp. 86]